jgi:hypothetical protein
MVARRSSEDLGFVPQTWLAAKDLKSSIALMTKRETLLELATIASDTVKLRQVA